MMMKDSKKVAAGKKLADYNHEKREELKAQKSELRANITVLELF